MCTFTHLCAFWVVIDVHICTSVCTFTHLHLQTCIGYVLDCIEARAQHGFTCAIGGKKMFLFPRIGAMSLDTIERVKYFGLANVSRCGICRRRKGRSAMRTATAHCVQEITNMYDAANAPDTNTRAGQRHRKRARERLHRHGFDYKKRCRLTDHAGCCLVQGNRLFAGLCRFERMHVYYIGYCSYLMELLIECVPKQSYAAVHKVVQACHQFRDPFTGKTHPRLPYVLKLTHLTAERRVRAIFYWAHVLGVKAEVVLEPCRVHAQCAVAYLQVILIATRGHRAYTSEELDLIFIQTGRAFFRHLEYLNEIVQRQKLARQHQRHASNPERYAAPTLWQKPATYVHIDVHICT